MSFVVGTAGHIDHGKSTLIRALTGIDPDRLAEEKRRGMTIDLGFAHLDLPRGQRVGIVDVPGHARFIRNMLAGVHGIDALLFVVAADEGVMAQTREHLEIAHLLEVSRGIVVLTKSDLVDGEWLDLVRAEVEDVLAGTSLAGAPFVPVSALTGSGLPELVDQLERVLEQTPPRADAGRPRLPIDRVFTVAGFGTVVTGTLVDGSLKMGEDLEIVPGGRRVRVRGLEQHGARTEVALPGTRAAVNLIGVERDELGRGDVLARPGALAATRRVDASVAVLEHAPRGLRHGAELTLHTGTVEVGARAIVLESDEIPPGGEGWVQLYLAHPIAAGAGDRFVLRFPSPAFTIAGGRFADVAPRRHPRHDTAVADSLRRRVAGEAMREELRKYPRGITRQALAKATLGDPKEADSLEARRAGQWLFAPEAWEALARRGAEVLEAYHREHPLREGMPREELRSRLGLLPPSSASVLAELARDGVLVERAGGALSLPRHEVAIDPASGGPAAALVAVLERHALAPPSLSDALREAGATQEVAKALFARGDLVRLSEDVAMTRGAYERAVAMVREVVAAEGSVTVARMRDLMGASRRPVLALLEHLDSARVTRRMGDARVLR